MTFAKTTSKLLLLSYLYNVSTVSASRIDLLERFGITNNGKYKSVEGQCGPAWTILKRHQVSVPTSSIFENENIPTEFSIVAVARVNKKRKFSHLFNIYNRGYRQLGINLAKKTCFIFTR